MREPSSNQAHGPRLSRGVPVPGREARIRRRRALILVSVMFFGGFAGALGVENLLGNRAGLGSRGYWSQSGGALAIPVAPDGKVILYQSDDGRSWYDCTRVGTFSHRFGVEPVCVPWLGAVVGARAFAELQMQLSDSPKEVEARRNTDAARIEAELRAELAKQIAELGAEDAEGRQAEFGRLSAMMRSGQRTHTSPSASAILALALNGVGSLGGIALPIVGVWNLLRTREERSAARLRTGQCPNCTYSLVGLAAAKCPECGWERAGATGAAKTAAVEPPAGSTHRPSTADDQAGQPEMPGSGGCTSS